MKPYVGQRPGTGAYYVLTTREVFTLHVDRLKRRVAWAWGMHRARKRLASPYARSEAWETAAVTAVWLLAAAGFYVAWVVTG